MSDTSSPNALQRVCRKLAIRPLADHAVPAPVDLAAIWPASFFRLERSAVWQQCDEATRQDMLRRCASQLLIEALGIERTAMDYCASRILTTDDALEKQVYSFTAADEARHFHWLSSLVDTAILTAPVDGFARFLQRLVAQGSAHSLSYLLQIILEGWGINHYQHLASHASNPQVAAVMSAIAQDEALHYAAGIAHFDASRLTVADHEFVQTSLTALCSMIACGPLGVLTVLEKAAGGFDATLRRDTFVRLSDADLTRQKLDKLMGYIAQSGMEAEVDRLQAQGLDRPLATDVALGFYSL